MSNKAVAGKIIEAWKLIGSIEKKGRNPKFNYAFVREEDAADALRNAFIKVGLSLIPSVEKLERSTIKTNAGGEMQHVIITMKFTLTDKDTGESDSFMMVGEAADSFDKATYKAITGCTKYAYTKLAMSGAEDNEDDTRESDKKEETKVKPVQQGATYKKPEEKPAETLTTKPSSASPPKATPKDTTSDQKDKPMSTHTEPAHDQSEIPTTEDTGKITAVIPAMKGKPASISFKPNGNRIVYAVHFDPKTTDVPTLLKTQQSKAEITIICDLSSGTPFLMSFQGV